MKKNVLWLKKLNVVIPFLGFLGTVISLIYCGIHFDPIPDWVNWFVVLIVPFASLTVVGAMRLDKYKKLKEKN